MKTKNIFCAFLVVSLLLSGCSNKKTSSPKTESPKNSSIEVSDNSVAPKEQKYYAPFTGEEVSKEVSQNIAFMTTIENSSAARPQSGFTSADIVYEAMTEGGTTRCFALFQKENCDKIGPVRSVRTYFIDLAYEYNVPFGHCGGSSDATERITKENLMSMNEMYNGSYYWRDKSIKVQEHSLYTSTEKLRSLATAKGYVKPITAKLKFDKAFWDNLSTASSNLVTIRFNGEYTTAYTYKDGLYYKSMNNVASENKEDKKPVAVKNLIIQKVNYRPRANSECLDADLIGQGDAIIFSNGKMINAKWSRTDLHSQTIFKDDKGNIIPLNPGKTWWHLLDQNASLKIS